MTKHRLAQWLERLPGGRRLRKAIAFRRHGRALRGLSTEQVFSDAYRTRAWQVGESASGPGSSLAETAAIREQIPTLVQRLGVSSLLDIPCGDFHWMQTVELAGIDYCGADIVADLVATNRRRYARAGVRFVHLDLIRDPLPRSDLILVRDCLIHLSAADIFAALGNLCRSRSTYLLTTTHHGHGRNRDISTGQWRPLDLSAPPFRLPEAITLINERHPDERFAAKALGLWRLEDVSDALAESIGSMPT